MGGHEAGKVDGGTVIGSHWGLNKLSCAFSGASWLEMMPIAFKALHIGLQFKMEVAPGLSRLLHPSLVATLPVTMTLDHVLFFPLYRQETESLLRDW